MAKSFRKFPTGPPPKIDEVPLTLMLLGKTGNGKSSLGNALLGLTNSDSAPFQSKSGMVSCEDYEPVLEEGTLQDRVVRIIDTPGVIDNVNPDEALNGVCRAISLNPDGVTAFVIVLRADFRFTKEESDAVIQLQTLFGDKIWQHAICVFTHGDALKGDRTKFEAEIQQARKKLPNLEKLMSSVGSRVMMVDCNKMGRTEIAEFLMMLDSLRNLNQGKYYSNRLFDEAQQRFKDGGGVELMASQRRNRQELRKLEAERNRQTEEQSKQMKEEIAKLRKQVEDMDREIKTLQAEVSKAAEKLAKKICVIL